MTPPEVLAFRQNGGAAERAGLGPARRAEQVSGAAGRGHSRSRRRGAVRSDERHRRARSDHRNARSRQDAGDDVASRRSSGCSGRSASGWLDLKQDRRFRYILIFKNHGAPAGATLEHSHSQLIALPIVPDFVREEIEGARRHYRGEGALRLLRHHPAGSQRRPAGDPRERRHRRARAVRAAVSVRDLAAAAQPRRAVRGGAAAAVREPGADAEVGAGADGHGRSSRRPTT